MKSLKKHGFTDVECTQYLLAFGAHVAGALGRFQVALAVLAASLFLALWSVPSAAQVVSASGYSAVPLYGWTRGVSNNGAAVWLSPSVAAKANIGQAIWNSAVPPSKSAVGSVGGKLPFGTGTAAVAAKGAITAGAVLSTFKTIMGGPLGVTVTALTVAPAVVEWLLADDARVAPVGSPLPFELKDEGVVCFAGSCYEYSYQGSDPWGSYMPACAQGVVARTSGAGVTGKFLSFEVSTSSCTYERTYLGSTTVGSFVLQRRLLPAGTIVIWNPADLTALEARVNSRPEVPVTSALVDALINMGGSLPISYAPDSGAGVGVATGPPSVASVPVVTSKVEGDVTTTTTTTAKTDLTYGTGTDPATGKTVPTVTGATNTVVTVTTTNNVTGATTTNNSTTNNPAAAAAEPPPDPCTANPNRAACLEIDVPQGEIPKVNKDVSYSPEAMFGGGACPSDRTIPQVLTGRPVVLSYGPTCEALASYVKPIILAIALYMAYLLILPGNRE